MAVLLKAFNIFDLAGHDFHMEVLVHANFTELVPAFSYTNHEIAFIYHLRANRTFILQSYNNAVVILFYPWALDD